MRRIGLLCLLVLLLGGISIPALGVSGPVLSVDVNAPTHPISPYIYGMNFADPVLAAEIGLPLNRWGGNDTSRYDWQLDTSSKGMDYFFENIPYKYENNQGADLPDESRVNKYIEQNQSWGGQTVITIPMMGWMPKDDEYGCSFRIDLYPPQQAYEPWRDDCGNGVLASNGQYITGNDPTQASRVIDEDFVTAWMQYLGSRYGTAQNGGIRFYNLDNEPMLWFETHRDVFQTSLGYDGLRDRTYLYARAVKDVDPTAQTMGPVGYGWEEYFFSDLDRAAGGEWWNTRPDRMAHGDVPLAEWYLQQMAAYEDLHGVRILDYLDEHFYPFFVALNNDVSPAMQAQRLRSTRFLWDPTYNQQPDNWYVTEPFRLIPRMQEWVANNYPGTKTAITEYNFGALNHINGALTQADVLGIFGREGLDLATLWASPSASDPGAYAFRMYLNYEGAGGKFGDTSVLSTSTDQGQLSIYGATRSIDGALTLMVINKTAVERTSTLTVTGFESSSVAEVWQYDAGNLNAIVRQPDGVVSGGVLTRNYPPESITLLVVTPPTIPAAELLTNGSFESGLTGWAASGAIGDKVKCDFVTPAKFASDGNCGLQVTGNAGITTRFTQKMSTILGVTGDLAVLSFMGKGKGLNASIQAKVTLNTTGGVLKFKRKLTKGSYVWQTFGTVQNLAGTLISGKVQIIIGPGTGKAYLDDFHLLIESSSSRNILPPPEVPSGFRK